MKSESSTEKLTGRLAGGYRDLEVYKDAELQESTHWIRTAFACSYLTKAVATEFAAQADSIGRMLNKMISKHEQFCHSKGS